MCCVHPRGVFLLLFFGATKDEFVSFGALVRFYRPMNVVRKRPHFVPPVASSTWRAIGGVCALLHASFLLQQKYGTFFPCSFSLWHFGEGRRATGTMVS